MSQSTIDDIMSRTSVRSFTSREIESDKMQTILHAAMAAPSAGNKQPWRFVVVNDKNILNTISADFPTMSMAKNAPVAVAVCGDTDATFPGEGRDYWIEDTSAAAENMLLAAHALGLGAVWCGIYPLNDRIASFSKMLRLPANILPMGLICFGYPHTHPTPKNKWNPDHVRFNTWE